MVIGFHLTDQHDQQATGGRQLLLARYKLHNLKNIHWAANCHSVIHGGSIQMERFPLSRRLISPLGSFNLRHRAVTVKWVDRFSSFFTAVTLLKQVNDTGARTCPFFKLYWIQRN